MKTEKELSEEIDKLEQEIIANPNISIDAKRWIIDFRKQSKEAKQEIMDFVKKTQWQK